MQRTLAVAAGVATHALFVLTVWRLVPSLTRRPKRVAEERLFLIGDAAGYVEPITGEGMLWAIMSACAIAPLDSAAVGGGRPGSRRIGTGCTGNCWAAE
jgi:2-polyprenyl-6-methoxyphenol hydroxylase-like FAD-dependent oxidoreductase